MLAEGIEVTGAALDRGLLHIDLRRPPPETQVRQIKIGKGAPAPATMTIDAKNDA